MARAYVMAGKSDLLDGKLKVFGHGSVETYQGRGSTMPLLLFHERAAAAELGEHRTAR